jgi:hypothetical protein
MANGLSDPVDALSGAAPYLRLFGLVTGGWLMARQALAASAAAAAGGTPELDVEFLRAKVVTARFYAEQLLPQAQGLVGAVTAGKRDLFAVEPKHLLGS